MTVTQRLQKSVKFDGIHISHGVQVRWRVFQRQVKHSQRPAAACASSKDEGHSIKDSASFGLRAFGSAAGEVGPSTGVRYRWCVLKDGQIGGACRKEDRTTAVRL